MEVEDERLWTLDENKGFSVRSMYKALVPGDSCSFPARLIWNSLILTKVSFFIWELWWDCAPTLDNLIRWDLIFPNRCSMCLSYGESSNHLFLHCSLASSL